MKRGKHCLFYAAAVLALTATTGCSKTPSYVIGKDDMAEIIADLNMGEAVVDFNYKEFPNDSTRKVLKQSIFANHGITQEDFDTSLYWYGHHLEEFIEMYDQSIKLLEERQRNIITAVNQQIAISGDSVDVWPGSRHLNVSSRLPMKILSFNIAADSNWRAGDIYILQYKTINSRQPVIGRIVADYEEGTSGYVQESSAGKDWTKIRLQLDSTLTPERVYGYIYASPAANEQFFIDSIALVRLRKNLYQHSYIHQNKFNYGVSPKKKTTDENSDSIDNTVAPEAATSTTIPPAPEKATSPAAVNTPSRATTRKRKTDLVPATEHKRKAIASH